MEVSDLMRGPLSKEKWRKRKLPRRRDLGVVDTGVNIESRNSNQNPTKKHQQRQHRREKKKTDF